jgi:L,D-transpeptidase catalytic domain
MTAAGLARATLLTGCAGLAAVGLASIVLTREADAQSARPLAAVVATPTPAFEVPEPLRFDPATETSRWASVRHEAPVVAAPSATSAVVAHLDARTPEGTTNVVLVGRYHRDRTGQLWRRILGAGEDFGGGWAWVTSDALGAGGVSHARLVIDRRTLTATLERSGRVRFRARIGIGAPDTPTPAGRFYIRNTLTRYASPRYGPVAFGTSAQSTATEWPGGGFIGIHGTNRPELLPGRVSHGCIRMANSDIVRLARQLRTGTPVVIL